MFTAVAVVGVENVFALPAPDPEVRHVRVIGSNAVVAPLRTSRIDQVVAVNGSVRSINIFAILTVENTEAEDGFAVEEIVPLAVFAILEVSEDSWKSEHPFIECTLQIIAYVQGAEIELRDSVSVRFFRELLIEEAVTFLSKSIACRAMTTSL
jgi:hypothetical protein